MTAKAADGQSAGEQKPADQKPAEQKPAEQKPAEQKPAEQKPADQKPAALTDDKPAEKPAAPESKAPAKYALTLPDGGRLDEHDLTSYEALAREQGWSNEEAQARVAAHAEAIEAESARFEAATRADPVYGGQHLEETQTHVRRALDHLRPKGSPRGDAFRALLNKSGYGNNLEVVSLFADLGKRMAEDGSFGGGGGGGDEELSTAERIYGRDKK